MKKNFYFLLMAALVCGLSLGVTSCKSDDDDSDNNGEDIEFNIATTCTMEQPYIVNEKFFGDTHRRFIIRHATGAELAKPKKFNKDEPISTLTEIYRYYYY